MPTSEDAAIAFAEKVLTLLDQGRFTATYKYAVLLGIMDLVLERTSADGAPPTTLTTRELAEKVVGLYWPQTTPFPERGILRQISGRPRQTAAILREVEQYRDSVAETLGQPLPRIERARSVDPDGYERTVREVEWKLIQMPLPRLQRFGDTDSQPFIYVIDWDEHVRKGDVRKYQRTGGGPFINTLKLQPGVGEHLVRLNNLLRPLIRRQWAAEVARLNQLQEAHLEQFLFGVDRIPLEPVRRPLLELQEGRCFYCDKRVTKGSEVDHFIPWSRYPDNGLDNLVVAHGGCNADKRDFLAASEHVSRWSERLRGPEGSGLPAQLADVAEHKGWERHPDRTAGVARALYLRLPEDARLWRLGKELVEPDVRELRRVLKAS